MTSSLSLPPQLQSKPWTPNSPTIWLTPHDSVRCAKWTAHNNVIIVVPFVTAPENARSWIGRCTSSSARPGTKNTTTAFILLALFVVFVFPVMSLRRVSCGMLLNSRALATSCTTLWTYQRALLKVTKPVYEMSKKKKANSM